MPTYSASCSETGAAAETIRGGFTRTINDPDTSTPMWTAVAEQLPAGYADPDAAYNAWAAAQTGATNVAINDLSYINNYQYIYVGFVVAEHGTENHIFLSPGGGILIFKTPRTDLSNVSQNNYTGFSAPSYAPGGTYYYPKFAMPNGQYPFFGITVNGGTNTASNAMSHVAVQYTADEVIAIFTQINYVAPPNNSARMAVRIRSGYLEIVAANIDGTNPRVQYITSASPYSTYADGSMLAGDFTYGFNGTAHWKSTDLSRLRPTLIDKPAIHDAPDEPAGTKWTSTPQLVHGLLVTERPGFTWPKLLTDNAGANDALTVLKRFGPILADTAGLNDAAAPRLSFRPIPVENLGASDLAAMGIPKALADNLGVSETFALSRRLAVLETLGLGDLLGPGLRFGYAQVDGIGISSAANLFLYALAVDNLGLNDAVARFFRAQPLLTETFQIADPVQPHFLLGVATHDAFGLHDTTALLQQLSAGLTDGVLITAGLVLPGTGAQGSGTITTWVVNTKTGGTTEYQNYEFNSFAQMGGAGGIGGRYLGASPNGLFELDGATDNGAAIAATIKTGYAQMGGTHLAGLKGVYLGVRGAGDLLLKLETGDGKSYTYQAVVGSMRNTKVEVGKGIRARYIAVTLQNVSGNDFDLDSIEFIPMVAQRRI